MIGYLKLLFRVGLPTLIFTYSNSGFAEPLYYVGSNFANLSYQYSAGLDEYVQNLDDYISNIEQDIVSGSQNSSVPMAYARLGVFFNEYLSFEWRAGAPVDNDNFNISFIDEIEKGAETGSSFPLAKCDAPGEGSCERLDATLEIDNIYGAYLRTGYPFYDRFYAYGVMGYTHYELDVRVRTQSSQGSVKTSISDEHVSFGVGIDTKIGSGFVLNIEYTQYFNENGEKYYGPSVGLAKHF